MKTKDFEYEITNDEVIIINYIGNETDVIIPAEINGCKVTCIGDYTFYDCNFITSITIPDSVTSIGHSAFDYCSSLTTVFIPNSVTDIGSYAFDGCSALTDVIIFDSVTSIGQGAFYCCPSLKNVTILNDVDKLAFGHISLDNEKIAETLANSVTPPCKFCVTYEKKCDYDKISSMYLKEWIEIEVLE